MLFVYQADMAFECHSHAFAVSNEKVFFFKLTGVELCITNTPDRHHKSEKCNLSTSQNQLI